MIKCCCSRVIANNLKKSFKKSIVFFVYSNILFYKSLSQTKQEVYGQDYGVKVCEINISEEKDTPKMVGPPSLKVRDQKMFFFYFLCSLQFLQEFSFAMTIHKEIFTTNAVCSAKHCVNPIFPGLEDLYTLSKEKFSCQSLKDVAKSLDFCKGVVNYNPSLPLPANSNKYLKIESVFIFKNDNNFSYISYNRSTFLKKKIYFF